MTKEESTVSISTTVQEQISHKREPVPVPVQTTRAQVDVVDPAEDEGNVCISCQ